MLRDKRKTADYFRKYITYQTGRIKKFKNILQQIDGKEENAAKKIQCHMYLTNFYQDLLFAEYSFGSSVPSLKKIYSEYLVHISAQNSLTYDMTVNALAWGILLEEKTDSLLNKVCYPQDGMLDAFSQYLAGNWPMKDLDKIPILLPMSEPFMQCLRGKASPEDLKNYMENDWYRSNYEAAWYESDKQDNDTYCGYWCLSGATVIKILQWNPKLFEDSVYCPVDLIL